MSRGYLVGHRPLDLAIEEIWHRPFGVAVKVHSQYTFNRTPLEDVILLATLDEDLEEGGEAIDFENVDDAMDDSIALTAKDARALGEMLIAAADKVEADGLGFVR